MMYERTTQVPNVLLDYFLPLLTEAELKLTLVIIRQTFGWIDKHTGMRKERDRLSGSQLRERTGLSKRIITKAVQSLIDKGLLEVSERKGNVLLFSCDRKGKSYLFYRVKIPEQILLKPSAQSAPSPAHICYHNKTNSTKLRRVKPERMFSGHIREAMAKSKLYGDPVTGIRRG